MRVIQVSVSIDSEEKARMIANAVIEQKLGACVQVLGPISSTYFWENKVQTDQEWLCVIKTTQECYTPLESLIVEMHHYEIPEIIVTPVVNGHGPYLDWVSDSVG